MDGAGVGLETVVVVEPGHLTAPLGDELAILTMDKGEYYGLDEVGTVVWNASLEPVRVLDVVNVVMDRFDGERQVVEADLVRLFSELVEAGLARVVG